MFGAVSRNERIAFSKPSELMSQNDSGAEKVQVYRYSPLIAVTPTECLNVVASRYCRLGEPWLMYS